jgi:pimeloyl-ACP methyl ester carboxylesterase
MRHGGILTILGVAAGAYLLVCLLAFLFQRHLIYFPFRWTEEQASRANPGYETLWLAGKDGVRLHAWMHRNEGSPWTVVITHGNAGNLMYHEPVLALCRSLGLQAILFDYRGYGLSTGRPTQEGLLRDAEAVVDYVEGSLGVPREHVVYFGQSLGSGVAALLAERRPPGRLILESAFPTLAEVAFHHYPFLPVRFLLLDPYDARRAFRRIACPVLFLHPAEDEIIPLALGRALFDQAREPKLFVPIPGAHHNDAYEVALGEHLRAIGEFLNGESAPVNPAPAPAPRDRPGGSAPSPRETGFRS